MARDEADAGGALVAHLRAFVEERAAGLRDLDAGVPCRDGAATRAGPGRPKRRRAAVILSSETALELGHPETASVATALTATPADVAPGRIRLLGPDLAGLPRGGRMPFAEVILLGVGPGYTLDPFALAEAPFAVDGLAGVMARALPGRLWLRIGARALRAGLSFEHLGRAVVGRCLAELRGVEAAEVLFVTSSEADVRALEPLAAAAEALAGRHKRLHLGADGTLACREATCDGCPEREVCDAARAILEARGA